MNSKLENLSKKFPLPKAWGAIQIFEDSLNIGNINLKMIGMNLGDGAEFQVTGSAVELESAPWERAYFELLERGLLLEAEKIASQSSLYYLSVFNASEVCMGTVNGIRVFKKDIINEKWKYSKSNGVAIQIGFRAASLSAGWELLERDRILRFWYSRRAPKLISDWQTVLPIELLNNFEINAYLFSEFDDDEQGIFVIGIFGFPKTQDTPFIMGLGAGASQAEALKKAITELYQRLAFLWGEPLPDKTPEFTINPQYHLDYYSFPSSWPYLKDWLNGKLTPRQLNFRHPNWKDLFFVKLDLPEISSEIHLIKAISNHNIPLTFGIGNPKIAFEVEDQEAIHPIA
jgi:hypothetical protein